MKLILSKEEIEKNINNLNIILLQYDNLRQCFTKLIKDILGENYYNLSMDVYDCDRIACEDIKNKLKKSWFS